LAAVILVVLAVVGSGAVLTLVTSASASSAAQIDIFGAPLGGMSVRGIVVLVAVAALMAGASIAAAVALLVSRERERVRLRLAIAEDDRHVRTVNEVQRDILARRFGSRVTTEEADGRSATRRRDRGVARDPRLETPPDASDTEIPLEPDPGRARERRWGRRSAPARNPVVSDSLIVLDDDEADTGPDTPTILPDPPIAARDR